MIMNRNMTRRALVKGALVAAGLIPMAVFVAGAAEGSLPPLDPSDPAAHGRDYTTKSLKSDATCANCSLYEGKPDDAMAGCRLFPGKSVAGAGWCSGWVKKSAA
jgi:hypothetical protein